MCELSNFRSELLKMNFIGAFEKKLNQYCYRYKVDLIVYGFHQFLTADDFIKFNYSYFMSMPIDDLEKLLLKLFDEHGIKFYREV